MRYATPRSLGLVGVVCMACACQGAGSSETSGAETNASSSSGSTSSTGETSSEESETGEGTDTGFPSAPEILAYDQAGARGIDVDETHVYWTAFMAGTVARVAKDGGEVEVLAVDEMVPWGIAVDGGWVYFSAYVAGEIKRVPAAGGPVELLATGAGPVTLLAIDGAWLYWADPKGSAVGRVSLDGAAVEADYFVDAQLADISGLDADAGRLLWTLSHDVGGGEKAYEARTAAQPPVTVTIVGQGDGVATHAQFLGDDVAWAAADSVWRVAFDGDSPTALASALPGTFEFAMTPDAAYFTNVVTPGLYRAPLGNAAPELVAPANRPEGCVADSTHVYWTDAGDGTISRVGIE